MCRSKEPSHLLFWNCKHFSEVGVRSVRWRQGKRDGGREAKGVTGARAKVLNAVIMSSELILKAVGSH